MDEYTYETIPMGGVMMEARFYTFNELRELLKAEEILNNHLAKAMGEVKSALKK
jgi:hypothetical protein